MHGTQPAHATCSRWLAALAIDCLAYWTTLMPTDTKYRDVRAALLAQGCIPKQGKGDHEKWYCPCGKHIAVVTQSRDVSAGVVADTIKKMACLPGGWLQ